MRFFTPKRKMGEIENKPLSKVDGRDEVNEERRGETREDEDEVEGEVEKGPRKVTEME